MSSIFRSVRFNVVLFAIIATLATIGTILPQTYDQADAVNAIIAHHPLLGHFLFSCGFFDVFHTFLFAGLLALMAFDVIVCKLVNKPPDPGLIPLESTIGDEQDLSLKALRKKPFRCEGVASGSVQSLSRPLLAFLKSHHYAVKKVRLSEEGLAVVASRHRLQRWGSYVSHISLVVILLGATVRSLFGFETFLPILEGQSASVTEALEQKLEESMRLPPDRGPRWTWDLLSLVLWPSRLHAAFQQHSLDPLDQWRIGVDKLSVDFYPGTTTPSTFASRVHLTEGDRTLADTTIRVNQPLQVRHVRFYQASWGVTGMLHGAVLRVGDRTLSLQTGDSFPVPGEPWTARLLYYLPDFTIGSDGQPTTASLEWKNPGLVLQFLNKKQTPIGTLVLGTPSPVAPAANQDWGMFFFAGGHLPVRPPFQVISADPVLFSGLQISYDPGFPIIVVGVLSMLLGLMALFYLHQRRVLVLIRPDGEEGVRIHAGGWSSRGEKEFAGEFTAICRTLGLHPVKGSR